ncbi:MAG: hypothetical protein HFI69_05765 [Lachnospiraceae bacterium]|nr:hypothetical protein [Lachnospiraceae bacterium]
MSKLNIWNEKNIKNKILICTKDESFGNHAKNFFAFPLSDILFSFYKTANIKEDFYSVEFFEKLLTQYKAENKELTESKKELIENGWISCSFGRWKYALGNLYTWEKVEREDDWEFKDSAIIRFFIWLKHQEREKRFNIEIINPEEILKCWKAASDTIPDLDWFINEHYLECLNGKYYAGHGRYPGKEAINQALAKLWLKWGESQRNDWIVMVLSLKGSYKIGEYLDEDTQKELIYFVLDNYIYKYPIPSWEDENRFYSKLRMVEVPAYCKEPNKYGKAELWTGNWVIDLLNYKHYGFDHYRWDDIREWEYTFLIASCVVYSRWRKDEQNKKFTDYLNGYDKISALYYILKLDMNIIYELLTESGTFFIGFRYLIHNIRDTVLDSDVYVNYICNIVDMIFEQGVKEKDFFKSEDIGSCLFFLKINCRSHQKIWIKLFKAIVLIIGKEKYLDVIMEELCIYFRTLLEIKRDVDWAMGYHTILFCVNQWFFENTNLQEKKYYRSFMDIVWRGYQIAFDGKSNYVTFLKEEYFSEPLCSELYRIYMKEEAAAKKRKLLLPVSNMQYNKRDNKIYHFYKLLLIIIYRIYEKDSETFVKSVMFETLEQVLIGENNKNKGALFNYSYMQIFSTESVICKCVSLLRYEQEESAYLQKNLLKADIPELLIFYEAAQDQRLKEEILKKINEKATETSLEVYDDSRALDLVMDFQIESLYPAVEYMLKRKLKKWGKMGFVKNEQYYQQALHQQYRLKYRKREYEDILRGDNVFFKAIVYMEADEYKDYEKADKLWKGMILDREHHNYASTVYLNYFYLLNKELDIAIKNQTAKQEKILENINWLIGIVEKEQIQKWSIDDKEAFGWFVVQSKKMHGDDYLRDFYIYKERYHLSMGIEEFYDEAKHEKESLQQNLYDNVSAANNVVEALKTFEAFDRTPKAQAYYQMRGYREAAEKDWGAVMLTEQVLRTCYALQNYGSQLIYEDKKIIYKKNEKKDYDLITVEKLYEDGVTMLFRELFNLAFGQLYNFTVHDQEKRASTGNCFAGRKSPAEIDLSVYYKDKCSEIMEAFVLADKTSKTIFKDHIEKAIGNNITNQPLTFILIYGNAKNSAGAWSKYKNYISHGLYHDFTGNVIERTSILELEEAPYFLKEFNSMYSGLKFLRQSIILKSGETQEILHIYIDIAKNFEGKIRKGCSKV